MPIEMLPEDLLAGRPLLRNPTPAESDEFQRLKAIHDTIPAFPGGDAGHFQPDFEKLFRVGLEGLKAEVSARLADTEDEEKRVFYAGCSEVLEAVSLYCRRAAGECETGKRSRTPRSPHIADSASATASPPPDTSWADATRPRAIASRMKRWRAASRPRSRLGGSSSGAAPASAA